MSKLSPAKRAALAAARAARQVAEPRTAPEGRRSPEHLLDDTREYCGQAYGRPAELADYLRVDKRSIARWLRREKMPLQATLEQIAQWRRTKSAGL